MIVCLYQYCDTQWLEHCISSESNMLKLKYECSKVYTVVKQSLIEEEHIFFLYVRVKCFFHHMCLFSPFTVKSKPVGFVMHRKKGQIREPLMKSKLGGSKLGPMLEELINSMLSYKAESRPSISDIHKTLKSSLGM